MKLRSHPHLARFAVPLAGLLAVACSSSAPSLSPGPDGGGDAAKPIDLDSATSATPDAASDASASDAASSDQLPPTGRAAIEAWLAAGRYNSWHCDPAMRAARAPSKNVMTRICSNDAASAQGAGVYAIGAAAVEEVGDATGTLIAYAVQRKMTAGGTADDWYWYGRFFTSSAALADGLGSDPLAQANCASCHQNAGADAGFGQDFVFTQIQ